MDSGWAQFRVIFDFEPRDERDIAIQEGDIMIVEKPVMDMLGWLTGENTRTKDVGEFPGTYVEYIGDVKELPQPEKPPTPPPRPPRRRLPRGSNVPRQESNKTPTPPPLPPRRRLPGEINIPRLVPRLEPYGSLAPCSRLHGQLDVEDLEYIDLEEEGDDFDSFFHRPRPQRPLNVMLANQRKTGVVEFLEAIRDGKLDEARTIYDVKKLDPNVTWTRGETGLHIAARNGYLKLVKFLIENGADVNIKEPSGTFPIDVAASSGHADIIKILIEAGSPLDDVDRFGRSPLMWATEGRHVEVVKVLLQAGASVTSQGNWHALHEACKAGYTELVQVLIDAAAPVNNPVQYPSRAPWSPLHIAVRQGHLDCVKLLISAGAIVNSVNADCGGTPCSPLHIAVQQGRLDCVKLLISAGAIVNSVNAGKHTPLHEAVYRGYDDIILELLLCGADPHAASNQKRTPLHEACIQGNVKAAVMLLDVGSKVNATDLLRDTPLHLTLRADHAYDIAVQLTTILLQYGASPTLLGRDDDMPIDIARQSGQTYCLELLELEMPQPLIRICKVYFRKMFACHWNDIEELPLPVTLKCFLINAAA